MPSRDLTSLPVLLHKSRKHLKSYSHTRTIAGDVKKESFELKSTMQDNPLATWKFTQITLVAKNAMHTYQLNVQVQKISLKSSTVC